MTSSTVISCSTAVVSIKDDLLRVTLKTKFPRKLSVAAGRLVYVHKSRTLSFDITKNVNRAEEMLKQESAADGKA